MRPKASASSSPAGGGGFSSPSACGREARVRVRGSERGRDRGSRQGARGQQLRATGACGRASADLYLRQLWVCSGNLANDVVGHIAVVGEQHQFGARRRRENDCGASRSCDALIYKRHALSLLEVLESLAELGGRKRGFDLDARACGFDGHQLERAEVEQSGNVHLIEDNQVHLVAQRPGAVDEEPLRTSKPRRKQARQKIGERFLSLAAVESWRPRLWLSVNVSSTPPSWSPTRRWCGPRWFARGTGRSHPA